MTPLFTVIVPVFNTHEQIFERCIESVILSLGKSEYEVIVVDDCSEEKISNKYIDICKKTKVRYIRNTSNRGVSFSRNEGLKRARGKYVLFVDSDDELAIGDIGRIKKLVSSSKYDVIIGDYYKNSAYEKIFNANVSLSIDRQTTINTLAYTDKLNSPFAKLFKKDIITKNNVCFDASMIEGEDAIFNIDSFKKSKSFYYICEPIYKYYYNINNQNIRCLNNTKMIVSNIVKMLEKKEELLDRGDKDSLVSFTNYKCTRLFRCYCYALVKDATDTCGDVRNMAHCINRKRICFINKVKMCIILSNCKIVNSLLKLRLEQKYRIKKNRSVS